MHDSIPREPIVYPRLAQLCLAFPEAVEVEQFGHPWFKAGKRPFCIYGTEPDHPTISFAAERDDQEALCNMGPFRPTPYMHQHGWVTYDVPAGEEPDWELVAELLTAGYRKVALARMVQALDARD